MKRLRLGRHHKDLVYIQEGEQPSNDDRRLAVFTTERDAAMVVGWSTHFWNTFRVSEHWERGEVDAAKDYWLEQLVALDRLIATNDDERFPIHRRMTEERLKPKRAHLAVLLRTLGVDVPEAPEVTG